MTNFRRAAFLTSRDITPHNAWGSREARQRIVGQLTENALGYFSGQALRVVS